MMICITCGMQQKHIIQLLDNSQIDDHVHLQYEKIDGMRIYFTCADIDQQEVKAKIKSIIKNDAIGKVLMYQIEAVDM